MFIQEFWFTHWELRKFSFFDFQVNFVAVLGTETLKYKKPPILPGIKTIQNDEFSVESISLRL